MDFNQFAKKFRGKLKKGDVIEVYYNKSDVDGQKARAVYYYLGWNTGEVGRALSASETLKEINHSKHRIPLSSIDSLFLYEPVR